MREPGPEDDLLIETSDLRDEHEAAVHARAGPFPAGPERRRRAGARDSAAWRRRRRSRRPGFKIVERRFAGNLPRRAAAVASRTSSSLLPGEKPSRTKPKSASASTSPLGDASNPPVEVTCTGPFHFDFIKYVAGFDKNVEVWQVNPEGPSRPTELRPARLCFARKRTPKPPPPQNRTRRGEPPAGGCPLAGAGPNHRRGLSGSDRLRRRAGRKSAAGGCS